MTTVTVFSILCIVSDFSQCVQCTVYKASQGLNDSSHSVQYTVHCQ